MTTKLEIIGPYTPEHEGPFSFNGEECLVHGTLGTQAFISRPESNKGFIVYTFDLKNAREVPVAREFWINECRRGDGSIGNTYPHETECEAMRERQELPHWNWVRTIHVREVLPGDDQ